MRLRLRTEQSPVFHRVHFRALLFESVHQISRELLGIRVAEHVPLPHHAPHPRQLHAHRLEPAPPALLESFFAISNLPSQLSRRRFHEPRVSPMSVSEEYAWGFATHI